MRVTGPGFAAPVAVVKKRRPGRPAAQPTSTPTTPQALVPAAARAREVLTVEEADLNAAAVEVFAKAVGGRDALVDVLSIAEAAPEIDRLVNHLLDPRYDGWTLKRLCRFTGTTVPELFAAYRKALIARAHIEASRIIAKKLPPIVDDVMTRATPQPVVCPACEGRTRVRVDGGLLHCTLCGATGVVQSEPALDRQKLALELGQLTEKRGGGLTIQQNQISAQLSSPSGGALEQLQQVMGELLFPTSRAQDPFPNPTPYTDPPDADAPTSPADVPADEEHEEEDDEDDTTPAPPDDALPSA